jgi:hypothetical protein
MRATNLEYRIAVLVALVRCRRRKINLVESGGRQP